MAGVSVRKRGKTWEYRFEGARIDGKRTRIEKGGFRTKRDAQDAGTKALAEYNRAGRHFTPSDISVEDFYKEWIDAYCKVNLKSTTVISYQSLIRNHITPAIGKYKLKAVTPAVLQKIINDAFNNGYSHNVLSNIRGLLTNSMNYAIEPLQYIQTSPMVGVRMPSKRAVPDTPQRRKVRKPLSADEWNRLIARFPAGTSCYIPLLLGYHCGLRLGEVFGLTWDDVDLENGTLSVNHQVQMVDEQWTLVPPKYDSYRTITLDDTVLSELRKARTAQLTHRKEYGVLYTQLYKTESGAIVSEDMGVPVDLVNVRENGEYIQPRVTQNLSKVAHQNLSMPNFDFHTLRHTHTTMLIEAGISPLVVQERLGHNNIQTTLNIYASVTDKMRDVAGVAINAVFAPNLPPHSEQ